jgi:demethylmenaquinone methyltransferase/2-methoxy-6-polyprenyl-1,4-benzoquinol methylase
MNEQPKPSNGSTTHFGFRDVPIGDKQKLVGRLRRA